MNSCEAPLKKIGRVQLQNVQNKTRELSALRLHQTQKQEQQTTQGISHSSRVLFYFVNVGAALYLIFFIFYGASQLYYSVADCKVLNTNT